MPILDHKPEIEYLDGRPFPKVSPRRTHALVRLAAADVLRRCSQRAGQVGPEWRFNVGAGQGSKTELVPDVSYVSRDRLRALAPQEREEPPFAPDVAVEIRSPSFRARLLHGKIVKYLAAGALLVLDVDPATRRVVAHARDGVRYFSQSDSFEHPAVPWLRFAIGELFAELDEPLD